MMKAEIENKQASSKKRQNQQQQTATIKNNNRKATKNKSPAKRNEWSFSGLRTDNKFPVLINNKGKINDAMKKSILRVVYYNTLSYSHTHGFGVYFLRIHEIILFFFDRQNPIYECVPILGNKILNIESLTLLFHFMLLVEISLLYFSFRSSVLGRRTFFSSLPLAVLLGPRSESVLCIYLCVYVLLQIVVNG